jgi:hypothetical protein
MDIQGFPRGLSDPISLFGSSLRMRKTVVVGWSKDASALVQEHDIYSYFTRILVLVAFGMQKRCGIPGFGNKKSDEY